jgi:hypothetical protein
MTMAQRIEAEERMERIAEMNLPDSSASNDKSKSLRNPVSGSLLDSMKIGLSSMAFYRGGEMSARELNLYSESLGDEFPNDGEDVIATLKHLERNRAEYERTIPAMPELVAMVRARRSERKRKIREAAEQAQHETKRKEIAEERLREQSTRTVHADIASKDDGGRGGSNL